MGYREHFVVNTGSSTTFPRDAGNRAWIRRDQPSRICSIEPPLSRIRCQRAADSPLFVLGDPPIYLNDPGPRGIVSTASPRRRKYQPASMLRLANSMDSRVIGNLLRDLPVIGFESEIFFFHITSASPCQGRRRSGSTSSNDGAELRHLPNCSYLILIGGVCRFVHPLVSKCRSAGSPCRPRC
jgi:hypothetical protein